MCLNKLANVEPISGSSSDRRLSHCLDAENCDAQLSNYADATAIEAEKYTLGNEECTDSCSMILKGGNNLSIIADVYGDIFFST